MLYGNWMLFARIESLLRSCLLYQRWNPNGGKPMELRMNIKFPKDEKQKEEMNKNRSNFGWILYF